MQVLALERLWAAKRWMSWRNYFEYLSGTLWWLEGVATILVFVVPAVILVSGAQTSTAGAGTFAAVFVTMLVIRLWGVWALFRGHLHMPTAFALRIFRVPVGVSCLWWLVTRRSLEFSVTPKAGASARSRGRPPRVVIALTVAVFGLLGYAVAGLLGWVPWRATPGATLASGIWLLLAGVGLVLGIKRVMSPAYATSRRNAHRIAVRAEVLLDGVAGELVDISVGGAAVAFPRGRRPVGGQVELTLPGAAPVRMITTGTKSADRADIVSMRIEDGDWDSYRALSMWLFHTPAGVLRGIPRGVPAVAAKRSQHESQVVGILVDPESKTE
jgi:cellulose synthase (UDP-forming)